MTHEEIKTFNELYRKFQEECEHVKEKMSVLPPGIGGDIYFADYFFRICDVGVDDVVLWRGYDLACEEVFGTFPIEYLSLTDEELETIVAEKKKEFEEEQLAERAKEEKKKKEKIFFYADIYVRGHRMIVESIITSDYRIICNWAVKFSLENFVE